MADVETVRLCFVGVDGLPLVEGETSIDAVRLRGVEPWRTSDEGIDACEETPAVLGGALAALVIDCFDSEELRESDVPPSANSAAATVGDFFSRPNGPAPAMSSTP